MEKNQSKKIQNKAIQMAKKAFKADEVPVGAVIFNTQTGEIIVAAHNQTEKKQDVLAHAEMVAIRRACQKLHCKFLDGYSIYVTLEPCTMCAGAIAWVRLDSLYYGAKDPKTGGVCQGARVFTRPQTHHKIRVRSKPCQCCGQLMHDFFQNKRIKKNK